MNVTLIDYESIQPTDLAGLQAEEAQVLVFVGAQQNRIPFDFANAMQQLGEHARYVKIAGTGRNALDFHLAFYLGQLVEQYPDGVFRVVSKDSGFDPLMKHLRERRIDVERWQALSSGTLTALSGCEAGLHRDMAAPSRLPAYTEPNRQS